MSVAFTVRLPLVSPHKTAIGTFTSPMLTPLLAREAQVDRLHVGYAGQVYDECVGSLTISARRARK
jgi:hypothetical protein